MSVRIEDYGLIGDCHTAALVSRAGSIDWLCLPRFDSAACFAALLGDEKHGRWLIAPKEGVQTVRRAYREGTLILETDFETDTGAVTVIDFMTPRESIPDLNRIVVGRRGRVTMNMEAVIRFEYGSLVPWVRRLDGGISAVAGPDAVHLHSSVELHGEKLTSVAEFTIAEGERAPFVLTWHPSHREPPTEVDAEAALGETERWWRAWSSRCTYEGPYREAVERSLITLKALTYAPTGGLVAAPTTSLPEFIGGVRNWDYRFCWLRDATFTLYSLMTAGYVDEAKRWRDWLVRALAGAPSQIQAVYGIAGERRLTEFELPWLPGYEGSKPVRIGNQAYEQFQLDVFGEVMDAMHYARQAGIDADENAWRIQRALIDHLETCWREPDEGIWEIRAGRRHFTYSKVMAWVALDRAVQAVERFQLDGPVDHWRRLRDRIHQQVCQEGFDQELGSFVQYYGSKEVDAALLMLPLVGFLSCDDPRIAGTVKEIERRLLHDGFVRRYAADSECDGLPPGEGTFLLCSFWLVDNYLLLNRRAEAEALFQRLLDLRNDLGLLPEEYDPAEKRFLGNFPQAFSHVALINSAYNLARGEGPSRERSQN